jgi:phosphoglucomutase
LKISPLAGKPAPAAMLVDVARLVTAYQTDTPDAPVPAQLVASGTSGTFNECHVLPIAGSS